MSFIAPDVMRLFDGWKVGEMYIPRHHHWIFPVAFFMGGFWIWQNVKPQTFDVIVAGGVMMLHGVIYSGYLYQVGVIYQNYICAINTPDPKPIEAKSEMPRVNASQVVPLQQVVPAVKFDMERQFAKTLIIMRDFKPNYEAVDLRETTWKRPNKFKTREAYISVRDKWEGRGILGRESTAKNARYIVTQWDAVELIADGNPLPF